MDKLWIILLIFVFIGVMGFYFMTVHSVTIENVSVTKITQKDIYSDQTVEYPIYLVNFTVTGHNPSETLEAKVSYVEDGKSQEGISGQVDVGDNSMSFYYYGGINPSEVTLKVEGNEISFEKTISESEFIDGGKVVDDTYSDMPRYDSSSSTSQESSSVSDESTSGSSNPFVSMVLNKYDLDNDGRLSGREWNNWCMQEGYDQMYHCDSDGDGYCSQSELEAYSHKYGF